MSSPSADQIAIQGDTPIGLLMLAAVELTLAFQDDGTKRAKLRRANAVEELKSAARSFTAAEKLSDLGL